MSDKAKESEAGAGKKGDNDVLKKEVGIVRQANKWSKNDKKEEIS